MFCRTGEISPVFTSVNLPVHYFIDSRLIALRIQSGSEVQTTYKLTGSSPSKRSNARVVLDPRT